jgi:hypothetical protein
LLEHGRGEGTGRTHRTVEDRIQRAKEAPYLRGACSATPRSPPGHGGCVPWCGGGTGCHPAGPDRSRRIPRGYRESHDRDPRFSRVGRSPLDRSRTSTPRGGF